MDLKANREEEYSDYNANVIVEEDGIYKKACLIRFLVVKMYIHTQNDQVCSNHHRKDWLVS